MRSSRVGGMLAPTHILPLLNKVCSPESKKCKNDSVNSKDFSSDHGNYDIFDISVRNRKYIRL